MIILKYSLAIFCLLLTGCSFFSSHKEKESTPLMEYEQTTEDIQPREECFRRAGRRRGWCGQ